MATAGPNNGATFVDDASVGTVAWNNPGNVQTSNNVYADAGFSIGTSHYLKATNFGFNIPFSDVKGIQVDVERNSGGATDSSIKIVKAGVITGTNKSAGAAWPGTDTYASFGSASDLWGTTWNFSDINNSGFGVVISAAISTGSSTNIDHIRITVTYQPLNKLKMIV